MTAIAKVDLRKEMPVVTDFIDRMRIAFGVDGVNTQIRKGMKGEAGFWALENGHAIGTPDLQCRWALMWDARGRGYSIESDWMFVARCIARARGIEIPHMTEQSCGGEREFDRIDRENHAIADQARMVYRSATEDEIFSASMIERDDYK